MEACREHRENGSVMPTKRVYRLRALRILLPSKFRNDSAIGSRKANSSAVVDRPRKKPRGLLLPPGEGDVPEANRFTYNAKGRMLFDPEETGEEGQEQGESPSTSHQLEEDWQEEEEDEFARMVSWLIFRSSRLTSSLERVWMRRVRMSEIWQRV